MTMLDRLLNYTIVIILAISSIIIWQKFADITRPEPLTYYSASAAQYEVNSGDTVTIHFKLHRTMTCPAVINRFWITRDGKAIVRLEPVFGGYSQPTNGIIDVPVEIKIPVTDFNGNLIPHGSIIGYSGYVTSICPSGTKTVSFPTTWFFLK